VAPWRLTPADGDDDAGEPDDPDLESADGRIPPGHDPDGTRPPTSQTGGGELGQADPPPPDRETI
jgi:hypothetical protein